MRGLVLLVLLIVFLTLVFLLGLRIDRRRGLLPPTASATAAERQTWLVARDMARVLERQVTDINVRPFLPPEMSEEISELLGRFYGTREIRER